MHVNLKDINITKENSLMKGKPEVAVATIGHIDHGKTTLTAAITRYLQEFGYAERKSYSDIDKAPEEKKRGITINSTTIEYETGTRHYTHTDCPGHSDYIKNMIVGSSRVDYPICVISVTDGPMPQTKEHIALIKSLGISKIIVYINKMDVAEDDYVDAFIDDIISYFDDNKYIDRDESGNPTNVVFGSALLANTETEPSKYGTESIKTLLEKLDNMPLPPRLSDQPLFMSIEGLQTGIKGAGGVFLARVVRGTLLMDQKIEIFGLDSGKKTVTVKTIESFKKSVKEAKPPLSIGFTIKENEKNLSDIKMAYAPGAMEIYDEFVADIYVLDGKTVIEKGVKKQIEPGRSTPFSQKFKPQLYFFGVLPVTVKDMAFHISKKVEGTEAVAPIYPGESARIKLRMAGGVPLKVGEQFFAMESKTTIFNGIVSAVGSNIDQNEFLPYPTTQKVKVVPGKKGK